ncbi:MAG: acetyl/propionyl/methylcrotonyl-CoA carboxylase subunit alpha [Tepidiformaceae bacterium]
MPRITKLLVANRGEIARRVFRAARDMGIATVAVYARPDESAPFVREADEAISLEGATSAETYLDISKLIDAARSSGADALHPGYGFLSENAAFARAVVDAGLVWVGPHPGAIAAMGDKLEAKRLVEKAAVPILPGVALAELAPGALTEAGAGIGYPLLVKAAGGGGGRGMRVVRDPGALAAAVAAARREAKGAFGDDRLFIERYLDDARHVEIQVLGDKHGNIVHCFERECSIQRRHQKIIEEAPSPAVGPDLRERMGAAAVAVARAIDYDSAGTVEFLLDGDGRFYFLEMNTRLQVEHPVTEAVTGLDLVREQIRLAEGETLGFTQDSLRISGHAIEARLYSEDPANNFLPVTGTVALWLPPPSPAGRWESAVETGSEVSIYFDPMVAKVITHAPSRGEAARRLASALEGLRLHGLTTNRDFLVATLRHEAFLAGDTTTAFIDRHRPARVRVPPEGEIRVAALAAALTGAARRRASSVILPFLPSGWRNSRGLMQQVRYLHGEGEILVAYSEARDGDFDYAFGERTGRARMVRFEPGLPGRVTLEVDGHRHELTVTAQGESTWVQGSAGEIALSEVPRFPLLQREAVAGGYTAPMPGKVLQIAIYKGESVTAGQLLLLVEAMKMEHRITCFEDGVVTELRVAAGQQVDRDEVLLVIATGGEAP